MKDIEMKSINQGRSAHTHTHTYINWEKITKIRLPALSGMKSSADWIYWIFWIFSFMDVTRGLAQRRAQINGTGDRVAI